MTKPHDKKNLPKREENPRNDRMRANMNLRPNEEVKERFTKALAVGRPTTMHDAIESLMTAYADAVERDGKQPEFPLEVRSKQPASSK